MSIADSIANCLEQRVISFWFMTQISIFSMCVDARVVPEEVMGIKIEAYSGNG
jgi:hypothetical protein